MDIEVREREGGVVVKVLVPKIDFSICGGIKNEILALIDNRQCRAMVLDLEEVSFMDSMSIGALVSLRKAMLNRDGRLVLCSLHPFVQKILSVVTVNAIFDVFGNEHEALKSLATG